MSFELFMFATTNFLMCSLNCLHRAGISVKREGICGYIDRGKGGMSQSHLLLYTRPQWAL